MIKVSRFFTKLYRVFNPSHEYVNYVNKCSFVLRSLWAITWVSAVTIIETTFIYKVITDSFTKSTFDSFHMIAGGILSAGIMFPLTIGLSFAIGIVVDKVRNDFLSNKSCGFIELNDSYD